MFSYVGRTVAVRVAEDLSLCLERLSPQATRYEVKADDNVVLSGNLATLGQCLNLTPTSDGALRFFIYDSSSNVIEEFVVHYHSNLLKQIARRMERVICNCCYENCHQCQGDDCCDICEELLKTSSLMASMIAYFNHADIVTTNIYEKLLELANRLYLYEDITGYRSYPLSDLHQILCDAYTTIINHILEHSVLNYNTTGNIDQNKYNALINGVFHLDKIKSCIQCGCNLNYSLNEITIRLNPCNFVATCNYAVTLLVEFDGEYNVVLTRNFNGLPIIYRIYSINRKIDNVKVLSVSGADCGNPNYQITGANVTFTDNTITVNPVCRHTPSLQNVQVVWNHDKSQQNAICNCDAIFDLTIETKTRDGDVLILVPSECRFQRNVLTIGNGSETVQIGSANNCSVPVQYRVTLSPKWFSGSECGNCILVGGTVKVYDSSNNIVATQTIPSVWTSPSLLIGDFSPNDLHRIEVDITYTRRPIEACSCSCDNIDDNTDDNTGNDNNNEESPTNERQYIFTFDVNCNFYCNPGQISIDVVYLVQNHDGNTYIMPRNYNVPNVGVYVATETISYSTQAPTITIQSISVPGHSPNITYSPSRTSAKIFCCARGSGNPTSLMLINRCNSRIRISSITVRCSGNNGNTVTINDNIYIEPNEFICARLTNCTAQQILSVNVQSDDNMPVCYEFDSCAYAIYFSCDCASDDSPPID